MVNPPKDMKVWMRGFITKLGLRKDTPNIDHVIDAMRYSLENSMFGVPDNAIVNAKTFEGLGKMFEEEARKKIDL